MLEREFQNELIRASAGTGKTYQLSNRYLALLASGARVDQILATTFTRKAAGEILDRVWLRLANAVIDQSAREELASQIDLELSRVQCAELLGTFVDQLHRVRIGTIDALFAQLARCYAFELRLPAGWVICDEIQELVQQDRAVRQMLAGGSNQQLLTILHMLAKGETTRGINALVSNTVQDAFQIFIQSARQAWEQVPRTTPLNAQEWEQALETLHEARVSFPQFKDTIEADYLRAISGDWDALLERGIAAKVAGRESTFSRKPIDEALIEVYRPIIAHTRASLVQQVALRTTAACDLLMEYTQEVDALKRQARMLGFADVTRELSRFVARDEVGIDQLTFRLDSRISHLLLDEFQDTSPEQWQIIRKFATDAVHSRGSHRSGSFFCVGDTKQAIYGWRGGVAEIFEAVGDEFADLDQRPLNLSYRSSPVVVDTVNQVFKNMARHPRLERYEDPIRKWSEAFPDHSTARTELEGHVTLEIAPADAEGAPDPRVTRRYAATRIQQLTQTCPHREIGVLLRTNEAVADMMYQLRHLGVAASEEGGNPLVDSAAVLYMRSLLELADHPGNRIAAFRLIHSPLADSFRLVNVDDLAATARAAQQVRTELIQDGYGKTMARYAEKIAPHVTPRDARRLEQLVDLAVAYDSTSTLRTRDFLEILDRQRIPDPNQSMVRVMTIHQAKGLQFDIVVLPELDKNLAGLHSPFVFHRPRPTDSIDQVCAFANQKVVDILPANFQQMFTETFTGQINESLCVLYVAMTRAIHSLHMIIAPSTENERSIPKKWSGLVRAALLGSARARPETVPYQVGNPDWAQPAESKPEPSAASPVATVAPKVIRFRPSQQPRRLPRISPSGLEGGGQTRVGDVFRFENLHARETGTAIHSCFEQLTWTDQDIPEVDALHAAMMRVLPGHRKQFQEWSDLFYRFIAQEQVGRALSQSAYQSLEDLGFSATVARQLDRQQLSWHPLPEQKILISTDSGLLSGSIDRLVLAKHGKTVVAADIIDFKTDQQGDDLDASLEAKVRFYRPQLEAYRQAVCRIYDLPAEQVHWRLVFLHADIVSDGRTQAVRQQELF